MPKFDPIRDAFAKKNNLSMNKEQADGMSDILSGAVERLTKNAEAQGSAKIIAALTEGQHPQQESTEDRTLKSIQTAKELAGLDEHRYNRYQQELEAERQKAESVQAQWKESQNGQMGMVTSMMQMFLQMSQQERERADRGRDRHEAMLAEMRRQHQEELRMMREEMKGQARNPEESLIHQFAMNHIQQLSSPPPDPYETLLRNKKMLTDLGLVGQQAGKSIDERRLDLEQQRLDQEFEFKQKQLDREWEMEQARAKGRDNQAQFLQEILPELLNRRRDGAEPTAQAKATPRYRYRCEGCGREGISSERVDETECPECGGRCVRVSA